MMRIIAMAWHLGEVHECFERCFHADTIASGVEMMHGKQQVRTIIDSLPDNLTTDQVMEELRFRLLVEETLEGLNERVEADRHASKWIDR